MPTLGPPAPVRQALPVKDLGPTGSRGEGGPRTRQKFNPEEGHLCGERERGADLELVGAVSPEGVWAQPCKTLALTPPPEAPALRLQPHPGFALASG